MEDQSSVVLTVADARSWKMRSRIFASLGIATLVTQAACGENASTTGTGGAGGNAVGTTATSGVTKASATAATTSSTQATTGVASSASTGTGGLVDVERCFANTAVPTPACPPPDMAAAAFGNCTTTAELVTTWISGPTVKTDACCYQVDVSDPNNGACGAVGRPLVIDAVARSARVAPYASDWLLTTGSPDLRDLDEATRLALADAWATEALYEHASIASFSKLSLELLAFGAPRSLVVDAHRAALDEVEHASLGFTFATAYAGSPRTPGAFEIVRETRLASTLADLAAQAVEEGCVNETLAALVASAQREAASDGVVVSALARIADDETRHAELSWRIVAWALSVGDDEVRARVVQAFERAVAESGREIELTSSDESSDRSLEVARSMRAHGRLSPVEVAREKARGLRDVVLPAMAALIAPRAC